MFRTGFDVDREDPHQEALGIPLFHRIGKGPPIRRPGRFGRLDKALRILVGNEHMAPACVRVRDP